MNIGKTIYTYRTAKNLSQEALADLLDVSRQSVSKWETNAAIPDLDKLLKLCDIFEITLDELTGRSVPKQAAPSQSPTQTIIGYILFVLSILAGVLILLFGTNPGDFVIMLPIGLSLLICAFLCLFAGKRAFYWCIWTALGPFAVLISSFSPFPPSATHTGTLAVIAIIMFFVAKQTFTDVVIAKEKKYCLILVGGWLLILLLGALNWILPIVIHQTLGYTTYSNAAFLILQFVCYALFSVLETYTVCYLRKRKK